MKKPSFSVVTFVVTALALMTMIRNALLPLIPPPKENLIAGEAGDFQQQGGHEEVKWVPYSDKVFTTARHDSKLILLVIGQPWTHVGRLLDSRTFLTPKVVGLLNREFVCVRIDATQNPAWASVFWPMSRMEHTDVQKEKDLQAGREKDKDLQERVAAELKRRHLRKPDGDFWDGLIAMPNGCQVWVLDASGNVLDLIGRHGTGDLADPYQFLSDLWAISRMEGGARLHPDFLHSYQSFDVERISRLELVGEPDFSGYEQQVASSSMLLSDSTPPVLLGFGWPTQKTQAPFPFCWKLMFLCGRAEDAQATLDRALKTSIVDLVDGGFFRNAENLDWSQVTYDKVATTNADMLDMLIVAWGVTGNPTYRWLAIKTFDFLYRGLQTPGLIAGGRAGDEQEDNRSLHSSFSLTDLRNNLPSADYQWATENLGLKPTVNLQMIPRLVDPSIIGTQRDRLEDVLKKLQSLAKLQPEPRLVANNLLDVNGHVYASLIRAARVFPEVCDQNDLITVAGLLDKFRTNDDVVHQVLTFGDPGTYLGDYLAYADCRLADYCLSGYVPSFKNGLAVLLRAIDLYGTDRSGIYNIWNPPLGVLAAQNVAVPEISDQIRESCSAQMIRLLYDYGRMLGPTPQGKRLQARAKEIVCRFSSLNDGLPYVAAYYCASAALTDTVWAVTVGPKALDLASKLVQMRPTRLVVPASGVVRPDLVGKEPGVYVVRGNVASHVDSLSEAADALSPSYDLGLPPR